VSEEFGVWGASAEAAPALPKLTADHECDVVVIGAGYTGLSTALHLAEAGQPCTVIEAHEPCSGASGRNTGWLEPNWWLKKPSDIGALFGAERGTELTRWVSSGPRLLDDWIARYALRTQIERGGLVLATDQPAKAAALEAEAREWNAAGIDHAYLDAAGVRRHIPSDRYQGALFLHNGATLNPLALSRELARACLEGGCSLFGNTPAHAL
jgi:glycine/D-amino acid oxidase-like deaminating enzyme